MDPTLAEFGRVVGPLSAPVIIDICDVDPNTVDELARAPVTCNAPQAASKRDIKPGCIQSNQTVFANRRVASCDPHGGLASREKRHRSAFGVNVFK